MQCGVPMSSVDGSDEDREAETNDGANLGTPISGSE